MLAETYRYPLITVQYEVILSHQVRDWLDTEEPSQLQINRGQKAKNGLISSNLQLVGAVVGRDSECGSLLYSHLENQKSPEAHDRAIHLCRVAAPVFLS